MEKMRKISIVSLTAEGFRNFDEPTTWTFGAVTLVSGHNAVGKSGIADALAFGLTGAPFFGGRGLDELQHSLEQSMRVEIHFLDQSARQHTLLRVRRNGEVTLSLDSAELPQKRFAELIGSKDFVLSLLNPAYFAEVLGTSGRGLLEQLIPAPAHEAVMEQLSEHTRSILGEDSLLQPDTYLKNKRAELKELEKDLQYATGQKDANDRQRTSIEAALGEKAQQLAHVCAALKVYEQKRTTGINRPALEAELKKLSAQFDSLQQEPPEITELRAARAKIEQQTFTSELEAQRARLETELTQKTAQHKRISDLKKKLFAGARCPTCLREIDQAGEPMIAAAYDNALKQIVEQGRALRASYETAARNEQSARNEWDAARQKQLQATDQKIEKLEQSRKEIDLDKLKLNMKALSYRLAFGMMGAEEARQYQPLSDQKAKLEAEISALNDTLDKLPKNQAQGIEEMQAKIFQIREKIKAAQMYLSMRNELMFGNLPGLHCAKIVLFEPVKETGEKRDVFQITYNDTPYVRLSMSERMKCGMELIGLLSRLSGCSYPVFLDNTESYCDLGGNFASSQIVMSRVQKGTPLMVRALKQGKRVEAHAA